MAADLRGDLLGAEADLNRRPDDRLWGETPGGLSPAQVRWLSPLPLWTGILAGPIAWALDLSISYAIVKWTCSSQRQAVLHAITPAALVIVAIGALASFMALQQTSGEHPSDGRPIRASAPGSWRFSA